MTHFWIGFEKIAMKVPGLIKKPGFVENAGPSKVKSFINRKSLSGFSTKGLSSTRAGRSV